MKTAIECYFSFRSPYSWLAIERLYCLPAGLRDRFVLKPVSPPPDIAERLAFSEAKLRYMATDLRRTASALGLKMRMPAAMDTDWPLPHATACAAIARSAGFAFTRALFRLRFQQRADVADVAVIARAAQECCLDAATLASDAQSEEMAGRLEQNRQDFAAAGACGVPFMVYREQHFWGNDRLEWLLREVQQDEGEEPPSLTEDVFACPCNAPGRA